MKNIETSFRQLRLFGIVYLCVCTLLVFFSVWKAYTFAEAQREKIYVLDEGKSLMLALSQDLEQNRPVEAREHVRRFHELFFTLSPDKSAIEGNIQRAMFLSDRSAYAHYVDLAEQGYYNRIISGNMSQRIVRPLHPKTIIISGKRNPIQQLIRVPVIIIKNNTQSILKKIDIQTEIILIGFFPRKIFIIKSPAIYWLQCRIS